MTGSLCIDCDQSQSWISFLLRSLAGTQIRSDDWLELKSGAMMSSHPLIKQLIKTLYK